MGKSNENEKKVVNQTNTKPNGVSDSAWQGTQETFSVSDKVNDAQLNMNSAYGNYVSHSNKNMISNSTKNAMNQSFKMPSAIKDADTFLATQLKKIQSGKTSYSDQIKDMMDKITNREKFSYDVDQDPLFQQALASAMNSGKQAMQDTIGQASALTGGYGSTYATSAGNQAYNSFVEGAYDNLPQYYEMAWNKYQAEGDEMYRQLGMYNEADDREYNRNVMAYDATYQHRNQMYNEAYTQYRDNKSDAFAMAGIEMQQYSQKANDLYNMYNMASNTYESMYEKEYQSWADKVNNAWKTVEVENSDWWNQTNFDESVRQYEKTFAEQQRQYNESLAFQKQQHSDQMSYNWASLNQKKSSGTTNLSNADIGKLEEVYTKAGGGTKGYEAVDNYLTSIGKNNMSAEESNALKNTLAGVDVPSYYQDWNMYDADGNLLEGANDTKNRGFLGTPLWKGEDHNDMYTNGTTSMSYDDLKEAINNSDLSEEEKKKKIDALKKQSKK